MSSGGYLKRPDDSGEQTQQQKQLWNDTSNRLQKFLPGLMEELFPESEVREEKGTETEAEAAPDRVEASTPVPTAEKGAEAA
jgi:brefeldin A-resistance guanine nucleotide exchange factor 1